MAAWLSVVGLGEDGWAGLVEPARAAVTSAEVVMGGARHLSLLPPCSDQLRIEWPTPFSGAFDMVSAHRGRAVCVLASGDPMLYGMGASLAKRFPSEEMRIFPGPSAFSLAAARLGWPLQDCITLTVHGRPLAQIQSRLTPGARLLVLSENGGTPAQLAALLCDRGFGDSVLHVLEHMGGAKEHRVEGTARGWSYPPGADLNVVAVHCQGAGPAFPCLAGLPDDAFAHDGQLTKRDIRALTLARLAPLPGQLLWDVGAGCGSVGIEWMRSHPSCRAVAIEANAARRALIEHNRDALGVPGLDIIAGRTPEALVGLPTPDAIFIGGGLSCDGVVSACWEALAPGGRLVANAVTVQGEAVLARLHADIGGELIRIAVSHAQTLGRFDAWQPAMPVTVLSAQKPFADPLPASIR